MTKLSLKKIRFRGLAFRYGMFFLVSILVVFIISFYYTFNNSRKLLLEQVEKNAGSLTQLTVSRIENILLPAQQMPVIYARTLSLPGNKLKEVLGEMDDFVRENEVVYGSIVAFEPYAADKKKKYWAPYFFYDEKSGPVNKMLGSKDYDYFTYDWYRIPKEKGVPVWTEPYFDKGGGEVLMCTYAVPFYRMVQGKKTFTGVVTMDLSMRVLDSIVSAVHIFKNGFGFMLSKGGKIIAFPDRKLINQDFYSFVQQNKGLRDIVQSMIKGETGFKNLTGLTRNPEAKNWIYYAPVPSTGWSLGIIVPEAELYEGLVGFFYKLFGMFVLGIVAIFVITILLTRKFMRPISKLAKATHEIGHGNFNAPIPVYRGGDEISQLSNSFLVMQEELNTYVRNLREAMAAREKIESELKIAREIQAGMLPASFPDRKDFDLYAILKPAREVSGDLYDFFFCDSDNLFFAVGDVSGKGVPASLFMAITRTLFRARMTNGASLCRVMSGINNDLVRENPNQMFVTVLAGILNLKTGVMEICNAGHNPALVLRKNGEVNRIKNPGNLPLGVMPDKNYCTGPEHLDPGDTIILYTDGITEASNNANEFYQEKRMVKLISAEETPTPVSIAEDLLKDVRDFEGDLEQSDDITLLVLKFNGNRQAFTGQENSISLVLKNEVPELDKIREAVEKISLEWALDPKTAMEVNLILEEVFSNIIFYAFDTQGSNEIKIDIEKTGDELVMTVADEGKPFNILEYTESQDYQEPADKRKIGGLGVHFIKTLAGKIDYSRTGNRNVVTIVRKINKKSI